MIYDFKKFKPDHLEIPNWNEVSELIHLAIHRTSSSTRWKTINEIPI